MRGLPWWLVSRISSARRVALVAVAAFELSEVGLLWSRGIERNNWVALVLGFVVLLLLLGFELAEHATTQRDHELSREISEWLIPHTPPSIGGVEVAFEYWMANHVGSDYYNVFPRWASGNPANSHRMFIVVADVAGAGMQGALLMATFQASLRALADSNMPLCDLASQMNQWSWDRSLDGRHFTMAFLAELDPDSGVLDYVRAGHQPPLIHRAGGEIERLEQGGFPLGALATSVYEKGSTAMEPGDTLVVFTDGVVKAENRRGEEFGEDRILYSLRATKGYTASAVLNHLMNSMRSFCQSFEQSDDLSFVVVRKCP